LRVAITSLVGGGIFVAGRTLLQESANVSGRFMGVVLTVVGAGKFSCSAFSLWRAASDLIIIGPAGRCW